MPIQKAAMKDLRKSRKRTLRNKREKTRIKSLLKSAQKKLQTEKALDENMIRDITSKLDRLAQKKIIKKNTAARKKSRLLKRLNTLKKQG